MAQLTLAELPSDALDLLKKQQPEIGRFLEDHTDCPEGSILFGRNAVQCRHCHQGDDPVIPAAWLDASDVIDASLGELRQAAVIRLYAAARATMRRVREGKPQRGRHRRSAELGLARRLSPPGPTSTN